MNWDPSTIRWNGALPVPASSLTTTPGVPTCELTLPPLNDVPLYSWIRYVLPSEQQRGPCCVGMAWANWLEAMLRHWAPHVLPRGTWQLDGERVWRRGRELFWKGDLEGGLYPSQGFAALLDLGWIPPDSRLRKIGSNWAAVGAALLAGPICQGHHVHAGWYRPAPENGCLDHAPVPTEGDGYHETLLIGRAVQIRDGEATRFFQGLNSWGNAWGWHGCYLMTEAEWREGLMPDGLYTADVCNLAGWPGWRDGVRMAT
jgi:hypothetical protein